MITDADIVKLKSAFREEFATRKEVEGQFSSFAKEVSQMFADFAEYMDKRFDTLEKRMDEGLMHLNKHDRRLGLHDDRITTLEVAGFKSSKQG